MARRHRKSAAHSASGKSKSPYVEVTFLVRDSQDRPIKGLQIQIRSTAKSPAWKWQAVEDTGGQESPPENSTAQPAKVKPKDGATPAPQAEPMVDNLLTKTTDEKGCAGTILNAANGKEIDVWVWSKGRNEWVWKTPVTPTYDINVVTIRSPEFHLPTSKTMKPCEGTPLVDMNIPKVNPGEIMTIDRLMNTFGPYIGWTQQVTQQGEVKKHHVKQTSDGTDDEKDKQGKKDFYYTVNKTGEPRTILLNVLGSTLNYPKKTKLTDSDYQMAAIELGLGNSHNAMAAVKAVALTESGTSAFLKNGLPSVRYEREVFLRAMLPESRQWEKTSKLKKEPIFHTLCNNQPNLCFYTGGMHQYSDKTGYSEENEEAWGHGDKDVMHQYERLVRAYTLLNKDAAIMACSWGSFQVLGIFYKQAGYHTPADMANDMMIGADKHLKFFLAHVKATAGAWDALQSHDWLSFAQNYNGRTSRAAGYAATIADNYKAAGGR